MAVIAKWIEELANGEEIESVIVGNHDREFYSESEPFNGVTVNLPISWEEAKPFLSYEYDNGFGRANCHPVIACTKSRIITVTEYDGATGPAWFPRNPIPVKVGFDGVSRW